MIAQFNLKTNNGGQIVYIDMGPSKKLQLENWRIIHAISEAAIEEAAIAGFSKKKQPSLNTHPYSSPVAQLSAKKRKKPNNRVLSTRTQVCPNCKTDGMKIHIKTDGPDMVTCNDCGFWGWLPDAKTQRGRNARN